MKKNVILLCFFCLLIIHSQAQEEEVITTSRFRLGVEASILWEYLSKFDRIRENRSCYYYYDDDYYSSESGRVEMNMLNDVNIDLATAACSAIIEFDGTETALTSLCGNLHFKCTQLLCIDDNVHRVFIRCFLR